MLILQMHLSAICPEGLTYVAAGGTSCQCSGSGTLDCPTLTSPGCYCPPDSYLNAQGVCAPNSECQRKWLRISLIQYFLHLHCRLFSAICEGGTTFIPEGGPICTCDLSGTISCHLSDGPGCYCPEDTFPNAEGVCTPVAECQRKFKTSSQ